MKIKDFIAGLEILAAHTENGLDQNWFMGAEHDQIYFYVDDETLPEDCDDGKKLIELGFFVDCDVGNWSMFT